MLPEQPGGRHGSLVPIYRTGRTGKVAWTLGEGKNNRGEMKGEDKDKPFNRNL